MATDQEIVELIAGNVRFFLARNRMRTEVAAEVVGLSPATFRLRKNGSSQYSALELVRLAERFRVDVHQLVTDPRAVRDDVGVPLPVLNDEVERTRKALDAKVADLEALSRRLRGQLNDASVAVELIRRELDEM